MQKRIYPVCKKCGQEPKKDKEMSNKNWNVYEHKLCEFCGGEMTLNILKEIKC